MIRGRVSRLLAVGCALTGLVVLLWPSASSAAPPANDAFASATLIRSVPSTDIANAAEATVEVGEPSGSCGSASGGTVWYAFVAPPGGGVVWTTSDYAPSAPAMIAAYTGGGSFASLSEVGCTLFFGAPTTQQLQVRGGTTYFFQVRPLSSASTAQLAFSLIFQPNPPPANDSFANASTISAVPSQNVSDNSSATVEAGEPGFCGPMTQSVWWSFRPASTTVVRADLNGSTFTGPEVAVYAQNGSGFGGLSGLTCLFETGTNRMLTLPAGKTYYFQAGSFFTGLNGMLHLNLTVVPPPANDDFAQAATIGQLPYAAPLDLSGATAQPAEPTPNCGGPPIGTAWYAFTPSVSGTFAGGIGSPNPFGFAVEYAVYTGSSLATLRQVACNLGNPLQFDADKGTTYYIQVANFSGQGSPVTLSLAQLRLRDTTPPTITTPSNAAVDATSPDGALVSYSVTVTDDVDQNPSWSCTPASGSSFPTGDTTVSCTASDATGNQATATFAVHVRGAAEQTSALADLVQATNAKQGIVNSLDAKLNAAQEALAAANADNRADASNKLDAFVNEVAAQAGKALTSDQATQLINAARRIQAVLG
jgi:hypothetical protein